MHRPAVRYPFLVRCFWKVLAFVAASPLAAMEEWTFHKSDDGTVPSGYEQQFMWLMNRARSNPEVEGLWLSFLRVANVVSGKTFFGVDNAVLRDEFLALDAFPPGAFDIRLHEAAIDHSNFLIDTDAQHHSGQTQRVRNAGFVFTSTRGAVYSYAKDGLHGHAGFNIDWGGNDETGMQNGRKHRAMIMSSFSNVGAGVVLEDNPDTLVGPLVTTINYAQADENEPDHYNRFIVGTVWQDANGNRLYDPGEGIEGITVQPDKGAFFAVTGAAGGYAIPVDPGSYELTYSGTGLPEVEVRQVPVADVSVLVPWIEFPELTPNPSISLNPTDLTFSVAWQFPYGEPSALEATGDFVNWTWQEEVSSIIPSLQQLEVSGTSENGLSAFRLRAWQF